MKNEFSIDFVQFTFGSGSGAVAGAGAGAGAVELDAEFFLFVLKNVFIHCTSL